MPLWYCPLDAIATLRREREMEPKPATTFLPAPPVEERHVRCSNKIKGIEIDEFRQSCLV